MENSASNNNEVSLHPQLDKVRISTMPEEFFSHAPAPKVSILVLSLVLLVLVCAGLLSWILIKQNMNPATQPIVVVNVNSASPDTNTPPTNTKINSNAPVNTPAVIPPPAPAVTAPLGGALVINQSTQDSDQDKLTDVEEELFGTDPKKPDSDGDNHTDGSELVNLFDPAKASPAKLDDSAFIRTVSV
ncbi:hypothetical protein HY224_03470, partial [Candidatus Uhrbacteria bacterium]|nr:hypothetical protein [Candidatus Uhrbacteria bacterium]